MHLLPLENNFAPSKVNNKTLSILLGPDQPLYTSETLYHYIFAYNCWNINQCFCPAEILTYFVKGNEEGRWFLQGAVTSQTHSQDFRCTGPQCIGGLHCEFMAWRGKLPNMLLTLPNMLLTYLIFIAFNYLND